MNKKCYYKVGISGHRDLIPSKLDIYYYKLKEHLTNLQKVYLDKELLILTPLADGADRLIAQVALDMRIKYDVILPMVKEIYIKDFSNNSKKKFNHFLAHARDIKTINLYAANTIELISKSSTHRNFQYRQVGREIVKMSDEMIIISDGVENNKMGGTMDIANYVKSYGKISYTIWCNRICA
jgi:hypothetical protein